VTRTASGLLGASVVLIVWMLCALATVPVQGAVTPNKGTEVQGTINSDLPPLKYRGDISTTVAFVNDLNKACGEPPKDKRWLGCRRGGIVYMPNPCPTGQVEEYAKIMCHEMGHVNGWTRDHPSD
jgi:hypothetical protein